MAENYHVFFKILWRKFIAESLLCCVCAGTRTMIKLVYFFAVIGNYFVHDSPSLPFPFINIKVLRCTVQINLVCCGGKILMYHVFVAEIFVVVEE